MQQWGEDPPSLSQLISAHKVGLLASEHIQDESLVCVRQVEALVACLVSEVQLTLHGLEGHAGLLQHHLGIHGLRASVHGVCALVCVCVCARMKDGGRWMDGWIGG